MANRPAIPRAHLLAPLAGLLALGGCAVAQPPAATAQPRVAQIEQVALKTGEQQARLELRLDRPPSGSSLRSGSEPPQHCGSGRRLAGDGPWLELTLRGAQAHRLERRAWQPRRGPVERLVIICDFEGQVGFAADLRRMATYRSVLEGEPPRLVLQIEE